MPFFYRLLSAFVADDEWHGLGFDSESQRLTFWIAVCSAAAGEDLLSRFRDTWGFPVDEAFYTQVIPLAQRLAARRDPATDAGQDHTIPLGQSADFSDAAAFDWEGDDLALDWQVVTRPTGSTASLSDPTALHPSFQPDRMGRYVLSLQADDGLIAGPGDTVTVTACVLAPPLVAITRRDADAVLTWAYQYATYEVYEHVSDPYVTPATGTLIGTGNGSFVHANALAPPYHSHYYIVKATCDGDVTSNRTGVFQYSITPGG
jgi:hypothetical protein